MNKTFKLFTYIEDMGDGSGTVRYFRTEAGLNAYIDKLHEDEDYCGYCDATGILEFSILEDGTIVDSNYQDEFYKSNNLLKIQD